MATWLQSLGNLNNSLTDKFMAGGIGKGLSSLGVTSGGIGGIANTIGQIGTGLLAGQNQTGVGNALQTIGGLASNIPGVGGLIGAGVGVVGGLVNAAFGSHINEEFVQQTQLGANQVGSQVFNANTNGDLLNDWQNMTQMSNVSKSEVGSDGWFSSAASDKTDELNRRIDEANRRQLANFGIAAENVDRQNDLRILQNMAAYGGPINSFRKYYSFGGPFGNYFEGEGEQSNSLRSPHVDLAVSNPWLYTKLHRSKKTKKAYEPTTFAGRVSQVAGASELGQKYTDYTSSVLQQVPVVGLGISALDLGYDTNRLYHNPSLSTTKDVALDAASLLPTLRKTLKGWWMKGNSGSFITEGGQVINNPRVASSLEVMLQPYRNAVNAGIYTGRAADFLDDSKAYLKEMWDHSPIGKAINEHSEGGYLSQAKALIRQNEGWREKPYKDAPKGKNWRSVGYGFNDSGFREKYPEGISKHYEHGITKKQAEEELDYFLNRAEKQLKSIYGKQWNDFTDSQKAAILDTYYQRPASVGKSSRFYKAVTAGEDAGRYLGVAGYNKRNKIRQGVFGGSQNYINFGEETENHSANPSSLQEVTPFTPVVHDLDLNGITPTQAKALELNLTSPTFDLSMFGKPMTAPAQQAVPTVGTVEDFLASYGDFDNNLFANGGELNIKGMNIYDFGGGLTHGSDWDTGINWVNEGGSHGENPLGGVQMGVDEQGVPNLVEEGEAIWNGDYVFSKRMKVPKKLAKKYGLGDDMTFADAIAKLTKDSEERPLSNIDRATNDHILGEFADSQEELRMAKAQRAMDKELQLQDDFLTGFQFGLGGHMSPLGIVPDADNISPFEKAEKLFADGGDIHIDPSKKGTFKAQASKMGMGVQEAASHILAHKENYSPEMVKKANFTKVFAHADGGDLFSNPFAYGGELGNVFAGEGDKANSLKFPIFDTPWSLGLEGTPNITYDFTAKDSPAKSTYGDFMNNNWFKIYNPNQWYAPDEIVPASKNTKGDSNRGKDKGGKSSKSGAKGAGKTSANRGSIVPFVYDWYRNGSDGIGTPTGFKVGKNGKAYDYTPEYKALVASLGADDIRKWAAEHPNDPSLKSFLAKGNKLEDLKDDQWRKGATDGKYGFMHHVADQIGKETATIPADYNWEQEAPWLFGDIVAPETTKPNPMAEIARDKSTPTRSVSVTDNGTNFGVVDTPQAITRSGITDTTSGAVDGITRSPFKPKQTWTRYAPMVMSGLMGLKEMLTPADYTNADAIMEAAYQAGAPVSVGTEYIGDYRKRDPFDERYLMNIINQRGSATNRNMMNLSGGNRAVAMSGILANDLTTQMSLAEAARQAYLANRTDDADVATFNKDTNKYNATAQNTRNLSLAQLNSGRQSAMLSGIAQSARLRQAIKDQRDAVISANLTNFAQGLGDLGKENGYYNMLGGLNEEGILKYFFGDDWRTKFNNVNV